MKNNLVLKAGDFNKHKSSFRTAQKDIFSIATKFINNENLKKLLFYGSKDALSKDNLTEAETMGLLHDNIKLVPKIPIDGEMKSYVIISFDNYMSNATNPEFRDNVITFDILCPIDMWVLEGYNLRPLRIMEEIDSMIDGQKMNGIGRAEFISANQLLLEKLAGFSMLYRVVNNV